MSVPERLHAVEEDGLARIAATTAVAELDALREELLGSESEAGLARRGLRDATPEERKTIGQAVNRLTSAVTEAIDGRRAELVAAEEEARLETERVDMTLPGRAPALGSAHLVMQVWAEIVDIFASLGYSVATGPEVETAFYNFDALNTPPTHPARLESDTLYVHYGDDPEAVLLRTQTSPVQARYMEAHDPPVYIVSPGRVFRRDETDATHTPVFHQMEGLAVDDGITFADLKGTLRTYARGFFGAGSEIRFLPNFFPFTEPSAEMHVSCFACDGSGCRTCSRTGWIELLGCGMVDPNVFEAVGYDPTEVTGFAFGMGIDRLATIRHRVPELRMFFDADLRVLEQYAMKVALRWIQEFVDLPTTDADELEGVMSNLGLEVEGIEAVRADFTGVVVGEVTEIVSHPDADKIRIVTLDIGGAEPHTVVCGAWNFDVGAVVVVALPGAVLPGGFEIGTREIEGVDSPGMICSEKELGLGDDADGILVLDDGHPPLGSDFAASLPYPDVVFDLSITPNRPDAMSVFGVARDLAAYYDIDLRRPDVDVVESGEPTTVRVSIEDAERCPRFTARELRGVSISRSPLWMRLRLRDAGMRPISNVVDITNYVMLEYGQPLHAFDLDRVPDESIVVRRARAGEELVTLDATRRKLVPEDLVISGPDEALALAGIMGGESSEVSDRTDRILLEVAHFSAPHVLLSGKRHALRSEAVARFERGVDPELPPLASSRAAALIAEYAGGEVAPGFVDEYPGRTDPLVVAMPVGEFERIVGVELTPEQVAGYLVRLGFGVEGGDPLQVTVPTYRPDVSRPADLVEELLRLHGFGTVPERVPHGEGGGLPVHEARRREVRTTMVGAGYHEIMTYAFVGPNDVRAMGYPESDPRAGSIAVRNPLNDEEGVLRTTLLPGLLRGIRTNLARNNPDVALFEVGRTFWRGDADLPHQPERLAFAATGSVPGPAWTSERPGRDWSDATGLIETLSVALDLEVDLDQAAEPGFHPGRCARVMLDGAIVGVVGEIHPAVTARFDVTGRVAAGEIDLSGVLVERPVADFRVPSPYPPVVFDLAFDLPAEVAAAEVIGAVSAGGGAGLERVVLFDVFEGPPLAEGRKSLAVRLTYRDPARTLTDDELAPVRETIARTVADRVGGVLRSG